MFIHRVGSKDITEYKEAFNFLGFENPIPEKYIPGFKYTLKNINDKISKLAIKLLESIELGLGKYNFI